NGIDHFSLLNLLNKNNIVMADFARNSSDLVEKIREEALPEDFIIFLGAGDITKWSYELADQLTKIDKNSEYC
ncbi:MAG: hypothetical protein LBE95_00175, partial [Holosporaceae bacterium]|nr:hypothetical protein [Holosporaceae bacterium]